MCHYAREIVHAMMHEATLELLIYSLFVALERERERGGGKGEKETNEREREGGERVVYRGGE